MANKMVYQWRSAPWAIPIPAQVAGEEIDKIRERDGELFSTASVLEEATPPTSPLHPAFEWDNTKAAHQYRLSQAGDLVRCLVVVNEAHPEIPEARAYVSVRVEDGHRYVSSAFAFRNTDMRAQILQNALNDIASFQRRYAELFGLAEQVDALVVRLTAEAEVARLAKPKRARPLGKGRKRVA